MKKRKPIVRHSVDAAVMLRQQLHAQAMRKAHHDSLREDGWEWSPTLQQWTHPDRPGVTISH